MSNFEHQIVFYHGTRRGNGFTQFNVAYANTGVGGNAFEQGNVFYLTNCPATAQWFANKAQTMALLRNWPRERLYEWPPQQADSQGDVLRFALCSGGKVKQLTAMPRGYRESAVVLTLARLEGYDLVSFHDTGFDTVEGDPLVAGLYRDGKPPMTAIPLHSDALVRMAD